jgi:hypothetical protein
MNGLRATVKNGRIIVDEPTALPEGTVLDLVVDDEGDDLGEEERMALRMAISQAWAEVRAGDLVPANELIEELRRRG